MRAGQSAPKPVIHRCIYLKLLFLSNFKFLSLRMNCTFTGPQVANYRFITICLYSLCGLETGTKQTSLSLPHQAAQILELTFCLSVLPGMRSKGSERCWARITIIFIFWERFGVWCVLAIRKTQTINNRRNKWTPNNSISDSFTGYRQTKS